MKIHYMRMQIIAILFLSISTLFAMDKTKHINLSEFGIKPNTGENMSPLFASAIEKIKAKQGKSQHIVIILDKGRYDFHPVDATTKEYYISNHDQENPKTLGMALEDINNWVLDGQGSDFIFHGRMLPISLINSKNVTLKNFAVDFEKPHITQIEILENDVKNGVITYKTAPWVDYVIKDSVFYNAGEGWELHPTAGIAFEEKTKHLVYQTSDIGVGTKGVVEVSKGIIKANWKNDKLIPGTRIAMRAWYRPTPGIFMSHDIDTKLENINMHYSEGMGLLAQMCENIELDGFSVRLRGDSDPRYFTAQADATHFSGCKGKIISKNGVYEGMMDDAINVHGTYLKVIRRVDSKTVIAQYMHSQSWGFEWGRVGDEVQFISSNTMELLDGKNKVAAIKPILDKKTTGKPSWFGAKEFEIKFEKALPAEFNELDGKASYGIENLEWTPEVVFSNNIVRNNRARGTLFSTPKKVLVENNVFDHTSGTAILLCGDANGWYETGACTDVTIRNNVFKNSLTNMFQFTNAVISIYPEIPNLKDQKKYFHSGIVIENNFFDTFDAPLVYAKSVDGLVFRNNIIMDNNDYPAFHWNKHRFLFERVINAKIENNMIPNLDMSKDLLEK